MNSTNRSVRSSATPRRPRCSLRLTRRRWTKCGTSLPTFAKTISASEVIRRMRGLLRKHELAPQTIEINDAVEEVLKLLSIDASTRKVSIKFERTAELPRVWCDPVHFQQVVLNLVLNGMEAMNGLPAEKRQVVVRTAPGDNGTVKVAVAD